MRRETCARPSSGANQLCERGQLTAFSRLLPMATLTSIFHLTHGVATVRTNWSNIKAFWKYHNARYLPVLAWFIWIAWEDLEGRRKTDFIPLPAPIILLSRHRANSSLSTQTNQHWSLPVLAPAPKYLKGRRFYPTQVIHSPVQKSSLSGSGFKVRRPGQVN